MNRSREILEHDGLKLFIDEIDMLGTYVEIEYQDTEDAVLKVYTRSFILRFLILIY